MKKEKIDKYILYMFLKKLYLYYDINFDKSIFSNISLDYISDYRLPLVYILNSTQNINMVFKFIEYYYKNSKNYVDEYKLDKISYKTLKLIILNECNILNKNSEVLNSKKSLFMYEKAKEFISILNNKKHIYSKKRK